VHKINVTELCKFLHNEFSVRLEPLSELKEIFLSDLDENEPNTLNWCSKDNIDWNSMKAAVLIAPSKIKIPTNCKTQVVKVERPRLVFAKILENFFNDITIHDISESAKIGTNCQIHSGVRIGHNCVIGDNVIIGKNSIIDHGVIIQKNTQIGKQCMLNANCIIGGHGFGYEKVEEDYIRIPHIGNVVIGDGVEVGALTCINRGTLGSTLVNNGVKIDDSSFIAHNVNVGKNTIICSHVVICGSVQIGKNSWIAPGVMVRDGITIGESATLGMGAIVTKSVDAETIVFGNPARKKI